MTTDDDATEREIMRATLRHEVRRILGEFESQRAMLRYARQQWPDEDWDAQEAQIDATEAAFRASLQSA